MVRSATGYLNLFSAGKRKPELTSIDFAQLFNMREVYNILPVCSEKALDGQARLKIVERPVDHERTP